MTTETETPSTDHSSALSASAPAAAASSDTSSVGAPADSDARMQSAPTDADPAEGAPLIRPSTTEHPLFDDVANACRTVFDPEIPVNIYDLGLVYTIEISDDNVVNIIMTLTAPGCPVAGDMPEWVQNAVESVDGVREVNVVMTFEPQWGMDMMSDEARLELGFM